MVTADLDGIRLLAPLRPAQRQALAARCAWRRFRPGRADPRAARPTTATCCFWSSGRVRVVNYAASGREIAYAVIEAGAHVGELAALDGEPRSASVEALDAVPDRVAAERAVPRAAAGPSRAGGGHAQERWRGSSGAPTSGSPSSACWAPCSGSIASCHAWPGPCPAARSSISPLPTQEALGRPGRHHARDGGPCARASSPGPASRGAAAAS